MLRLEEACPWKEHLFELERTLGLSESAKFMLYKEGDSDKWRVQVSQGTRKQSLLYGENKLVKLRVETCGAQSEYQLSGCGIRDVSLLYVILRFS